MDPNDPFEVQLAKGWREYGFSTPDELIEARRTYGWIKDEYNPLLRGRIVRRAVSSGGGFFLGATLGYLFGKNRHCSH